MHITHTRSDSLKGGKETDTAETGAAAHLLMTHQSCLLIKADQQDWDAVYMYVQQQAAALDLTIISLMRVRDWSPNNRRVPMPKCDAHHTTHEKRLQGKGGVFWIGRICQKLDFVH